MILEWLKSLDSEKAVSVLLDVLGGSLVLVGSVLLLFYSAKFGMYGAWHLRQWRWRRNPKVGDKAIFYNLGGGLTVGKVEGVSENKLKVSLHTTHGSGFSNGWYSVKDLFHITKEEEDHIYNLNLKNLLKRTKGIK
jgi:hypothetical protein